jgi:hypothetical protein
MDEDAGSQAVTLGEYVLRETLDELEAAVRAARPCTYSHVSPLAARFDKPGFTQPIFSCRTCAANNGGAPVGVCEPCMLSCHTEHEVVEVGDRHGFRCDCPTVRSAVSCIAGKPAAQAAAGATGGADDRAPAGAAGGAGAAGAVLPANDGNAYGHNFEDRWCSCDRAYDEGRDTMYQCGACNEWFHDFHIPGVLPGSFAIDTHMCASCVARLPFLRAFAQYRRGVCSRRVTRAAPASASKPGLGSASAASAGHGTPQSATTASVSPGTAASGSRSEAHVPGSGLSTRSDGDGELPASTMLQPWVACLTCTQGADDGRGVCMACAAACHADHVLGEPRITEFVCDCAELSAAAGGCRCSQPTLAAAAPAAPAVRTCLLPSAAAATPIKPPAVGAVAPTYGGGDAGLRTWCAAIPVVDASLAVVPKAAIFLNDEADLLMQLCRCDACMATYAAAGVLGWLEAEEEAGDAADPLPDLAAAAPPAGGAGGAASASSGFGAAQLPVNVPPGFRTSYECAWEEFLKLPQTTQVDLLHGYNDLSGEFLEYLRGFAGTGAVVTEAHVRSFFTNFLTSHRDKRQRQRQEVGME